MQHRALLLAALLLAAPSLASAADLTAEAVNTAEPGAKAAGELSPVLLRAQSMLARAGFSPGVIDGYDGDNFRKALLAFQEQSGLEAKGRLDEATWGRLVEIAPGPAIIEYEVTEADTKGPFVPEMPKDLEEKAALDHLGYRDPREGLAEKFHMDEDTLAALNKGKAFDRVGERISVADVSRPGSTAKVTRIEIDKPAKALRAFAEDGALVAVYPASIGSTQKPAPSGSFKVLAIAKKPTWTYDPAFAFEGVKSDRKVVVKAGPNNPVGSTWIDLDADTYGIHGTPDPEKVGKTASNGCVRLTNWDVQALASMVQPGTTVEFRE